MKLRLGAMRYAGQYIAVLSIFCSPPGCSKRSRALVEPGRAASRTAFARLVEHDIGAAVAVSNLQGVALTFQGYEAWLRFSTDADLPALLLKAGYRTATWRMVAHSFDLPAQLAPEFTPPWTPSTVKTKRCFFGEVRNTWTHSGTHCFVIDLDAGVVYFAGMGS